MESLPSYVSIVFILTTILTVFLFYKATQRSYLTVIVIIAWPGIQAVIGKNGFYTVTNTLPPRFLLAIVPPLVLIVALFSTNKGRNYIDRLDKNILTLLHIVRIPVELVLLWLSIHKLVPTLMTFEGRNPDILSGISAPFVYYFGFVKKRIGNTALLVWNFICLALLFNIVITAILSAPFPFQKFGFDQPNVAIFYFPFIWLPCFIVPVVLFSHLATIRKLIYEREKRLAVSY